MCSVGFPDRRLLNRSRYFNRIVLFTCYDMCGGADVDVANALVFMKHTAETRRPPLRSVNRRGLNGARSPSPPEFGSEEDRKRLQRKRLVVTYCCCEICTKSAI